MHNSEILKFYNTNGFYVERLFSSEKMDKYREESDRLLKFRGEDTRPYAYPHEDSKLFDDLWKHPRTLEILELLIGSKVHGLQTWMYFKPPGEFGRDIHQNIFYTHANKGDIINASLAIDDSNKENGCLYAYIGSHVEWCLPIEKDDERIKTNPKDWRNERGKPCAVPGEWVDGVWTEKYKKKYLPLNSGEIIFLHSHVLHGSDDNNSSDKWRRAFLCGYLREGAHFNPGGQMKRVGLSF